MKRIIKFGGSLFDCHGIGHRLQDWMAKNRDVPNIVVCGGGMFVDCIRQWDKRHRLSQESAHWLSVESLSITAQLLAQLLPGSVVTDSFLRATTSRHETVIFQPFRWLQSQADAPKTWDFTSDSIAASLAVASHAPELVLLKSALPSPPINLVELGERGFTDCHFAEIAQHVNLLRIVNLRHCLGDEVCLTRNSVSLPDSAVSTAVNCADHS